MSPHVIYFGYGFLKERLMYFRNKLFVKQVKSFCLLLDFSPFISCVHFTTCTTTSLSYFYSITQLSHSLFPFVVILSRVKFVCLFSTDLKFLQRRSKTDPRLRAQGSQGSIYSKASGHCEAALTSVMALIDI